MKTGLVLEGGGLRGVFSAGVMDVLMEEGIEFDGAIGVSAGAAFGCNYKSRQPRRAILYNMKFAKDPRYSSMRSLIATGDLFNAQFCYHDIPEKLYPFDWEAFRQNPMEFYLVCTDVETGEPVYHLHPLFLSKKRYSFFHRFAVSAVTYILYTYPYHRDKALLLLP